MNIRSLLNLISLLNRFLKSLLTLSDSTLVENLEHTKKTAAEIELKVIESKKTSSEIDKVITTNISFKKLSR